MSHTVPLPIGIVITRFRPGGTERQMIELIRRLDRARWDVHVACVAQEGSWLGRVSESGATITAFPLTSFKKPSIVRHARNFAAWCRDRQLAVVHTSDLYMNIFALPAAAAAGVPVRIANRREINPGKSAAQIAMQRAAYGFAHRIVANAQAGAERLRWERVPAAKIAVIPNGLDVARFSASSARADRRRIGIVANLRPEKGHDVLIEAAPAVLRACPSAHFDIIGDGPLRAALAARVSERGLARAFTFHGHCEDVPSALSAVDVFVLPSRSEAFPNAVLEAMAAGLPIVASRVGGIGEVVSHGTTGLLVPPGDAGALARGLVDLLSNRALADALGRAARAEATTRYSFERMVGAFDSLYTSELAQRGLLRSVQPRLAAS